MWRLEKQYYKFYQVYANDEQARAALLMSNTISFPASALTSSASLLVSFNIQDFRYMNSLPL